MVMPSTLQLVIIAALAAFVLGFYGAWQVRGWKADAQIAAIRTEYQEAHTKALAAKDKKIASYQKLAGALERRIQDLRDLPPEIKTIKVKEYVRAENITCPVSADGLQLVNSAVAAANRARTETR